MADEVAAGGSGDGPGPEPDGGGPETEWPGLESLPPSPPSEWGRPRAYRARPPVEPSSGREDEPPIPAPEPDGRRWWWLAGPVAVALAAVLTWSLVAARADHLAAPPPTAAGSTTVTTAPSTTSTSTGPTTTTAPTTTTTVPLAADPPLEAAVAELSGFVAELRGHPFASPPPAVRLDDDAFQTAIRQQYPRGSLRGRASLFGVLGLVAEDDDWEHRYVDELARTTAGFVPGDRRLIILRGDRGRALDEGDRAVLVHELTHILDRDVAPSTRPEVGDPATEARFGYEAALEGDAIRVADEWRASHGHGAGREPGRQFADVTQAEIGAVYAFGSSLVRKVAARGGEAAVDQLLLAPPPTSEQVMHPEKYLAHEPEAPVAAPPGEGPTREGPPIGELLTQQMLEGLVDEPDTAAAGWGGDRSVTWVRPRGQGGLTCLRIRYVMDTPADLDELAAAFEHWAAKAPNRTAVRESDHLDVTACNRVPTPPGASLD